MSTEHSFKELSFPPSLCIQARTLVDLDLAEVAFAIRVPVRDLEAYEAGAEPLPEGTQARLRRYFEISGVRFQPQDRRRGVSLA